MATQLSHKREAETPTIPDRLYFKIGDVARLCGLETYVLRFWESQFPQLKPNKGGTGQRLYRRREVELVLEIKRLVYTEGYTLSGARQALEQQHRKPASTEARTLQEAKPESAGVQIAEVAAMHPAAESASVSTAEPNPDHAHQPHISLQTANGTRHSDAVAATIGRARAELREIAALLAAPPPRTIRRRPRVTQMAAASDSLFPA